MIVVMKTSATEENIEHLVEQVESLGLKANVLRGTERTVVAAIGDERVEGVRSLESSPGVDNVMAVLAPYKLASREAHEETSTIRAGSLAVGGEAVGVIAGPCSVESEEQIVATARAVKEAGATALRGGAFKPRTSPYSFQGMKEDGLKLLRAAQQETGLAIVTEVVSPEDVDLVAGYADVLQIGARNMQNYRLLEACGRADAAVLLKRGPSATMDELLLAAEYILDGGNSRVMLCERGVRTFEAHTRFTLPLASVPYLQQKTHLPVVIDPSHGTGHAYLVPDMARASVAAGCDGLAIEVHQDPAHAMTDGAQSITPAVLAELMGSLARVAQAVDRTCLPLAVV